MKIGCLGTVIVLLFVVIFVNLPRGNKSSAPQPQPQPTPQQPPTAVAPAPAPLAPSAPAPVVAAPAAAPARPAASTLEGELAYAQADSAAASRSAAAAKVAALARVRSTPAYQQAAATLATSLAVVKKNRAEHETDVDAGKDWLAASGKVNRMETEAVKNDPTIKAALSKVTAEAATIDNLKIRINERDVMARSAQAVKDRDIAMRKAYYVAKEYVPRLLKNPRSADFDRDTVRVEVLTAGKQWRVTGAVDATNSFGATVRSKWQVTVALSGEDFQMTGIGLLP